MGLDDRPIPSDDTRLAADIEDALAAYAADGQDGLTRWLDEHPASELPVREHVARLGRLGLLDLSGERAGRLDASAATDRIGGFRLLERIGEGGMGLVWIAEEEALGRRVALKMIRPEQLWFAGARERFRREVEAVARLQHPGIVPVYAAGEEGGVPFFTMELVDGCTLADVLRVLRGADPARLSGADLARALDEAAPVRAEEIDERRVRGALFEGSWPDACLGLARQVAEALDHAHGRGLVHRDVKPSNIALTRTGRAQLFDFGLVRSDDAQHATRTTSQPGSLPYMAPEQITGHEVDERSDLYSLGVTLYELLTLGKPYAETHVIALVERVLAGKPAPIRARNRAVSWEAETVCLKAMDVEPAGRYASADDLARDLTNVLERRPIAARRTSLARRAQRWSQRDPGAAAALVLAFLLFAAGPAAWALRERATGRRILAQSGQISAANRALEDALAATRREQERAESNYRDALGAVDQMLTRLADRRLAHVPHVEGLRRELYGDALAYYEGFAQRRADDPELRHELARARMRMSTLLSYLGRDAEVDARLNECIDLLEQCLADAPADPQLRLELATALTMSSTIQGNLGRLEQREAAAARSLAIFRELAAEHPDVIDYRRGAATALESLATTLARTGRPDEARSLYEEAFDLLDGDAAETDTRAGELLVTISKQLGTVLVQLGRPEDAEALLQSALAVAERWTERETDNPVFADCAADLLHPLALAALARGNHAEALELWTRQLAVAERLVRDFPSYHIYRDDLLRACANRGLALGHMHRFAEAEQVFRRAVELALEIVAALPDALAHHIQLVMVRANLAEILMRQERFEAALAVLEETQAEAALIEQVRDTDREVRTLVANLLAIRAESALGLGRHAQGVADLRALRAGVAEQDMRFDVAILFGRCIERARADDALAADRREALAAGYEDETLDALRWAVAGGFRDLARLERSSALELVRSRPEYEEIVRPLRAAQ